MAIDVKKKIVHPYLDEPIPSVRGSDGFYINHIFHRGFYKQRLHLWTFGYSERKRVKFSELQVGHFNDNTEKICICNVWLLTCMDAPS